MCPECWVRVFIAFRHLVHSRPTIPWQWSASRGSFVFIAFRHLVHSRRDWRTLVLATIVEESSLPFGI
ncbi:MAG: hypothetical protein M2R45_03553 [Verrucomicrobia subdivision 3 bacterium]|nr:hypothetical protein [Limisphaerales bacterium]MCS1416470.1 hypothetical protein [Limisphaerales bacterium]